MINLPSSTSISEQDLKFSFSISRSVSGNKRTRVRSESKKKCKTTRTKFSTTPSFTKKVDHVQPPASNSSAATLSTAVIQSDGLTAYKSAADLSRAEPAEPISL